MSQSVKVFQVYIEIMKGIIEVSDEDEPKEQLVEEDRRQCNPKNASENKKLQLQLSRLLRPHMRNPN
jgi:hypothetical protein